MVEGVVASGVVVGRGGGGTAAPAGNHAGDVIQPEVALLGEDDEGGWWLEALDERELQGCDGEVADGDCFGGHGYYLAVPGTGGVGAHGGWWEKRGVYISTTKRGSMRSKCRVGWG